MKEAPLHPPLTSLPGNVWAGRNFANLIHAYRGPTRKALCGRTHKDPVDSADQVHEAITCAGCRIKLRQMGSCGFRG